jgi:hypothetical protein
MAKCDGEQERKRLRQETRRQRRIGLARGLAERLGPEGVGWLDSQLADCDWFDDESHLGRTLHTARKLAGLPARPVLIDQWDANAGKVIKQDLNANHALAD